MASWAHAALMAPEVRKLRGMWKPRANELYIREARDSGIEAQRLVRQAAPALASGTGSTWDLGTDTGARGQQLCQGWKAGCGDEELFISVCTVKRWRSRAAMAAETILGAGPFRA
jgi:hypothetical protein